MRRDADGVFWNVYGYSFGRQELRDVRPVVFDRGNLCEWDVRAGLRRVDQMRWRMRRHGVERQKLRGLWQCVRHGADVSGERVYMRRRSIQLRRRRIKRMRIECTVSVRTRHDAAMLEWDGRDAQHRDMQRRRSDVRCVGPVLGILSGGCVSVADNVQ